MFGKEKGSKEEKQLRQQQEVMEKYGLQDLSDPQDIESVKKIVQELYGTNVMEAGLKLSGSPADIEKVIFLRTLIEQNFIIIRQLDRISKK